MSLICISMRSGTELRNRYVMKRENGFMHDVITSSCGQLFVMAIMFGMNKLLSMNLAPAEYALYGIANKSAQVVSFV